MRAALVVIVCFGCASQKPAPPPPAAAQAPATAPPPAAAPVAPAATTESSPPSGPMTAAEAARQAERGAAGDAASDDSPCAADADCALTQVAPGACCPLLCAARVVTAKRAAELKEKSASCGRPCPLPQCMPPRERVLPACVQNRCVAKTAPTEN